MRGPGLLPKCRVFPQFSRGFAFRILISGKVSPAGAVPQALHPIPGRLPDSLFGKREPTQELTLRACSCLLCHIFALLRLPVRSYKGPPRQPKAECSIGPHQGCGQATRPRASGPDQRLDLFADLVNPCASTSLGSEDGNALMLTKAPQRLQGCVSSHLEF
jgi:hypothetical protein